MIVQKALDVADRKELSDLADHRPTIPAFSLYIPLWKNILVDPMDFQLYHPLLLGWLGGLLRRSAVG